MEGRMLQTITMQNYHKAKQEFELLSHLYSPRMPLEYLCLDLQYYNI